MSLNRTKWIFDLSALKKGDVLFTRSKFVGTGIARATKGRFGHVMLYLDSTIIHADTKGVWSKNPQRIIMNDQSRLAAFRLKEDLPPESVERIESYARSRVGGIYSIPQAVKSLQEASKKSADRLILDRQFCSRLVAQSFAEIGIQLVADTNFCTPNEIAESALLREVTNAVRMATAKDIDFYKTPDFNLEIQVETYRWLKKVRDLAHKHQLRAVYSQSDVGQWVLDHPHFDTEICTYIEETKYLSLNDVDRRKNPWRYEPKSMLVALMAHSSPEDALSFEIYQNEQNLKRIHEQRTIAIHNARSGLGYFKIEEKLQTSRLAQMYLWKDAVDYASKFIHQQI